MPASARRIEPVPAPETRDTRLLTTVFWVGVGLSPAAALLLLLGHSQGPLRVGAVLALLAVVLIGLSIALRQDTGADLSDKLLDEVDLVRDDVRADVATRFSAAQRGFGERIQALQQSVEAMRGELAAIRALASPAGASPAGASVGSASVGSASVGSASVGSASVGSAPVGSGSVGSASVGSAPVGPASDLSPNLQHANFRHSGRGPAARSAVPAHQVNGDGVAALARGASRGVVRRTETVHVTTRRTIVDDAAGRHSGSGEYEIGTGYHRRSEPPPAAGWHHNEPEDQSPGRHGQHSREYRIGERRTAMHADETGTQMRIEDRWASMREDSCPANARHELAWGRERDQNRGLGWDRQADWDQQPDWDRQPDRDAAHDRQQRRALPAHATSDEESSCAWLRDLREPDRPDWDRPGRDWHQPEPMEYGGHRQRAEPDDGRYGHGYAERYGHGYVYGSEYGPEYGPEYGSEYGSEPRNRR